MSNIVNFEQNIDKYAQTVIEVGVNLQKDEYCFIVSDIQTAVLARALTKYAYQKGAKRVIVFYGDEQNTKTNYTMASKEALADIFDWEADSKNIIADVKGCYISIVSSDPDLLCGIDAEKIAYVRNQTRKKYAKFNNECNTNGVKWCVISGASQSWANKVFPNCDSAVDKLWDLIFKANRIDCENPVEEWQKHIDKLADRCNNLNNLNLKTLVYKSSNGTDLTVDLPDNYVFLGGAENSKSGCPFSANMPTEEVFSAPHKYGVNGKLVASLPLSYAGNIIKDFGFTFKDGAVVDFYASQGYESLKQIIDTDDGAKHLGEIALISFDSPINDTKTLFYETLFDENASCHFALGCAYPTCVKGGENLSEQEMDKAGINYSDTHVDFMVGTRDLSIVGITNDGNQVPIMVDGNLVV